MKILLTNCWQAGNTGDVAIWKNLMKYLLEAFPNSEFLIASQMLLEWDVNQLLEYKVRFYVNRLEEAVRDADVVISQGGGYMIGDGMSDVLKSFKLAQDLNKPTFFSTQTFVGPISIETKELLKEVLNKAIVISPREQETYNLLKDAGVDENKMEILPDTVFDIQSKNCNYDHPDSIKFAIRGYNISQETIEEIALLADMLTETIGQVTFIPVGNSNDRDDRVIAKKITSLMKHEAIVINEKLTAEELKFILKDGILISDRYHAIVYAASMSTPFIALTPDIDSKMPGLLRLLDYSIQEIFDKNTLKAETVFPSILDIWFNKVKYKDLLKLKIPTIKEDCVKV
jgi:polysaccharide pyruvyl transferase WcaK-like protein